MLKRYQLNPAPICGISANRGALVPANDYLIQGRRSGFSSAVAPEPTLPARLEIG
jgi:hypothetical protein